MLRGVPVSTPWDVVRPTARETAWGCAGAAAWSAARLAVGASAGDRARATAQAAAADGATAIARAHVAAAGDRSGPLHRAATRELVRNALSPTRQALEDSAIALLARMLPGERLEIPAPAPVFTVSV